MDPFTTWLTTRGPAIIHAMDQHRDQICGIVSGRLATVFPTLCYDPSRPDAEHFQQRTYYEVPRRFQRVLQVVIVFQSLAIIEKEYVWGWPILINYGVTRQHMLAHVRWYFDALRTSVSFESDDIPHLNTLEKAILQIVDQVTTTSTPSSQKNFVDVQPQTYHLNGSSH